MNNGATFLIKKKGTNIRPKTGTKYLTPKKSSKQTSVTKVRSDKTLKKRVPSVFEMTPVVKV